MSIYELPEDEVANLRSNRLIGLRSLVSQRQLDHVVFTAQGKTDEASAAQAEIDDAKAAIDALLALD